MARCRTNWSVLGNRINVPFLLDSLACDNGENATGFTQVASLQTVSTASAVGLADKTSCEKFTAEIRKYCPMTLDRTGPRHDVNG